jgi:hypothetical protein
MAEIFHRDEDVFLKLGHAVRMKEAFSKLSGKETERLTRFCVRPTIDTDQIALQEQTALGKKPSRTRRSFP